MDYSVQRSDQELNNLKSNNKGRYVLNPTNAKNLINLQEGIMTYIFWLPKWGNSPPFYPCHFFGSCKYFKAPFITLYPDKKRLENQMGYVNLNGGLPHEFWRFICRLAKDNGFKGVMPSKKDWNQIKEEIQLQGLPVPTTVYDEYYANLITWRFIKALKHKYDRSQQEK